MFKKSLFLKVFVLSVVSVVIELTFFASLAAFFSDYSSVVHPLGLWLAVYFVVSFVGWSFGLILWPTLYSSSVFDFIRPASKGNATQIERWVCVGITMLFLLTLVTNPLLLSCKLFGALLLVFMCYYCYQQFRGKLG